ncbi:MAG: 50S ribosomal protein L6 [Phycisphaerae bacterium]|nr:50S ribosomal protein L6 [Phycisphaerae bacterium]
MSRIGKKPIPVPAGVKVALNPGARTIEISGPKGSVKSTYRPEVTVTWTESEKTIAVSTDTSKIDEGNRRAYWGLTRANIQNMIEGVTKGYEKTLEINGVGWGAKLQGKEIVLTLGYCDPIHLAVPTNVKVEVNNNQVKLSGPDKQSVGEFAARIRAERKPEPYNGKGVKYLDETIIRKQGKAFGS